MREPSEDAGVHRAGGVGFRFPKPSSAVKALLVVNIAVFLLQVFFDQSRAGVGPMSQWLGVTVAAWWQVWRYLTFQFLHGDLWHILLNMLGLYMLGSPLETTWGPRRFVTFYLSCGALAGLAYVLIGAGFHQSATRPIIGASGGVYAVVLAAAVLFPGFKILLLVLPVSIRLAAVVIFGGMIFIVVQSLGAGDGGRAMSDVAHLGGAAAAAGWIWLLPKLKGTGARVGPKRPRGAWRRKMEKRAKDEAEIDRILQKVHDHGLASLTGREKKTLQNATQRQRETEREICRH